MSLADITQEIREIDLELKKHAEHNSPLQLRAWRRRRAKLHRMLNDHAQFVRHHGSREQLSLSL